MATQKRKAPPHAFKPGQSGNLKGKPAGTRSKSTQLLMAMMEGDASAITKAVIDAAKGGDLMAAKIILDRLIPPAKERPISLDLPDTKTADGVSAAQSAILQAVAGGELLPGEASTRAPLWRASAGPLKHKTWPTVSPNWKTKMATLERRVAELETRITAVPLTAAEQRQRTDDFYYTHGTSRAQVIAEHGSEAAGAYAWMKTPSDELALPVPGDGLTAAERYAAMLRKPARPAPREVKNEKS